MDDLEDRLAPLALGVPDEHGGWSNGSAPARHQPPYGPLIAERRIPYPKVDKLIRFDPGQISRWLDEWIDQVLFAEWAGQCIKAQHR